MNVDTIRSAIADRSTHGSVDLHATRDDLAQAFGALGFKRGAEIGVETGVYSEVLLQANPDLYLHCVDAWKAYRDYREHVTQSKVDGLYQQAKERLSPFYGRVGLIRKFSVEAARDFKDGALDFVYIDANHGLPHVIADLQAWVPKVRAGGIVAGHDFRKSKGDRPFHVPQAIGAWTNAYRVEPWFVLRGDSAPSWFWVAK